MYAHCRADLSLNHCADFRKITEPISFHPILINVAMSDSWPTNNIGVNDPQTFVFKEMGGVLRHSAPLLSSRFRDGITWKEDKTGCLSVLQPSKKRENDLRCMNEIKLPFPGFGVHMLVWQELQTRGLRLVQG